MSEENRELTRRRRRQEEDTEPESIPEPDMIDDQDMPETATATGDEAELPAAIGDEAEPFAGAGDETEAPAGTGDLPETAGSELPQERDPASRVPQQARQMSASPYGAINAIAARRPGTRPATAVRRPPVQIPPRPMPERRKPAPAEGGAPETRTLRESPSSRMQIGYAPGRMRESQMDFKETEPGGETRVQPITPADGGSLYAPLRKGERVRTYPQNRYQPPLMQQESRKPKKRHPFRILLIVLVVAAAACAAAMLLLPEDNVIRVKLTAAANAVAEPVRGLFGGRKKSSVSKFTITGNEKQTAPAGVEVSVTTDKDVVEIRLVDEDGEPLKAEITQFDNTGAFLWTLSAWIENGYDGTVHLQTRREGEEWQDTEYQADIQMASPPAQTTPPEETAPIAETEKTDGSKAAETEDAAPEEAAPVTADAAAEDPEAEAAAEGFEAEEAVEDFEAEEAAAADEEAPEDEEDPEEAPEDGEDPEEEVPEDKEDPEETPEDGKAPEDSEPEQTPGEETKEEAALTEKADMPEAEKPADGEAGDGNSAEAEPSPEPTVIPALTVQAAPGANPDLISTVTVYNGSKKVKNYTRPAKELIRMPSGWDYTPEKMGVLTFRGNAFRTNAAVGNVVSAESLEKVWQVEAGSSRGAQQTYYGYEWTGQPAIMKWSKQVRQASNIDEDKKLLAPLQEVIIAGVDGVIRFLDLRDGTLTRSAINLGYPMQGTPSIHSNGYPYMSVGQFARKMKVKTGKIGLRQYNLYTQKEITLIDGLDGKLHRNLNTVGSFETSALIDRNSDTLITAGSNGLLYLVRLNCEFDWKAGTLKTNASTVVLASKAKGQKKTTLLAVESSPAMYDRYVYYADMGGILRCVDTNFMAPVWAVDTEDAVMAAIALDQRDPTSLDLYTANMLYNRKKGSATVRRMDALSGREIWAYDVPVQKDAKNTEEAGFKASPVIGENRLEELVYFTVTGLSEEGRNRLNAGEAKAALIALNKEDGTVRWSRGLPDASVSSPIAVYDEAGNGWIIQASWDGTLLLLDGLTGEEKASLQLEGNISASPAAYNDMLVIGTTGKGTEFVYGVKIQ